MFAPLFNCPVHGDTWHARIGEVIDHENDEVYKFMYCPVCRREVRPVIVDGKQVVHPLSKEEIYWDNWGSEDDDYEDEDYEDGYEF